MLVDGHGIPLAVAIDGANRPDMRLVEATLAAVIVPRRVPTAEQPQHLCLDKGYAYAVVREALAARDYVAQIARRGEEAASKSRIPGYRARRWVVERIHAWMNRFRRLLVRWEKKVENYEAIVHLACAWISFHAAGIDRQERVARGLAG